MASPLIRKLPENLINKIAAGEVVERPASVVKELVENALDAGSRDITVEVGGAGKDLIRVSDDGGGMGAQDLPLAFERHSTSKIKDDDDLFRVVTMGFRGEALAAISSVSETSIETSDGREGFSLECRFGILGTLQPAARARGTTVTVKNLFQNVPVRRKFLKSDPTEFSHIAETLTRIGLAWPSLRLRLFHDGKEFLHFSPQRDAAARVAQVLGLPDLREYLPVRYEDQSCTLEGFAGTLAAARKNWQGMYFFVNNRPVSGKSIFYALKAGYGGNLPAGMCPAGVFFLKINFDEVDVNVHPAKSEIRFLQEQQVQQVIRRAVARALEKADIAAPFSSGFPGKEAPATVAFPEPRWSGTPAGIPESAPFRRPRVSWQNPAPIPVTDPLLFAEQSREGIGPSGSPPPLVQYFQVHDTYILCQVKSGLMLIDQHVAHERILYEGALANLGKQQSLSQSLLFPITLELEPASLAAVQGNLANFRNVGFDLDLFGGNTVIIRGVPPQIKNADIVLQMREMIDFLLREEGGANPLDNFAKAYACGAAIKAGQPLSLEEMNHLVENLFQCQSPYACPHGRPTIVKLTLDEINRRFMRT